MNESHVKMILKMREKWIWTYFAIMMLGIWLISSPFTFNFKSHAMDISDILSGILLIFFSGLALFPRFDFVGRWTVCVIGIWLEFAPLVFWSPTAAAYLNDTLVGVFVIALSIIIPGMPGMAHHMMMIKPGPEIPPGWSYNPSSWYQRAPLIALAFLGWLIARYLAAFQLGYIQTVWDPFFEEGTVKVLTSKVSQAFPVSDAGLGALAYTFEMLMGWMGSKTRWRSTPWMSMFFFILVVPLGIVSIILVILQPVIVGHWCFLCLFTATLMLMMIPFAVDEIVAVHQFLSQSVKQGKPFWHTFWVGGTLENEKENSQNADSNVSTVLRMTQGVTISWNLIISTLLGLWIMATPYYFGTSGVISDSNHIVGALVVATSVIVMAEVIRAGRFLNIILGIWIIISPWILSNSTELGWNNLIIGLALILLSFPRGQIKEKYGN